MGFNEYRGQFDDQRDNIWKVQAPQKVRFSQGTSSNNSLKNTARFFFLSRIWGAHARYFLNQVNMMQLKNHRRQS